MKLGISGTRQPQIGYAEWESLLLDKVNVNDITEIVSGGAKGVDSFARTFASRHRKPLMELKPDYGAYGRSAPLVRNRQIVRESNVLVAFPSSESRGTIRTIEEARRIGRKVIIIKI